MGDDIFDLNKEEKPSIKSEKPKQTVENKVADKKASKFKPVYFFGLVAVATIIWILYPSLFSGGKKNAHNNTTDVPYYTAPSQTVQQTPLSVTQTESIQPVRTGSAPANSDIDAMLRVATEPPANIMNELNQLKTEVAGLRQDLTTLVRLIDSNSAATQTNTQNINALIAMQQQAAVTQQQTETDQQSVTTAPSQLRAVTRQSTVPGFTLNTIYQTQAWIEDSNRVYVVRVGDTVGNIKIQRISPDTREVFTSRGVIR